MIQKIIWKKNLVIYHGYDSLLKHSRMSIWYLLLILFASLGALLAQRSRPLKCCSKRRRKPLRTLLPLSCYVELELNRSVAVGSTHATECTTIRRIDSESGEVVPVLDDFCDYNMHNREIWFAKSTDALYAPCICNIRHMLFSCNRLHYTGYDHNQLAILFTRNLLRHTPVDARLLQHGDRWLMLHPDWRKISRRLRHTMGIMIPLPSSVVMLASRWLCCDTKRFKKIQN